MLGRYVHHVLALEGHRIQAVPREENPCDMNFLDLSVLCQGSEVIINCIGAIPQRQSDDPETYIRVNTKFPLLLEKVSLHLGCVLIHITTDCVYDGKRGKYIESDIHTANDLYGQSKSLGEPEHACVIRTSIIGESVHGKGLLEWVRSQPEGSRIDGYANHHWNGVTCLQLAKYITELIGKNICWVGVRHYYGDDITKHRLIEKIIRTYDLKIKVNPKITRNKHGNPTSIDRTLRSIRQFPLPPTIDVMLQEQRDFTEVISEMKKNDDAAATKQHASDADDDIGST
jgi:dTDP-4-dehydrorhamnose reductase